jgi:hypothetical protein
MKKKILGLFAMLALVFAFSNCGGGKATEESMEVSPEMKEFIGMLNGTSDDVTAALAKFGASDAIMNNDMSMYNLAEPKITGKEADCYTTEFKAGITTRIYSICWSNGKISAITELEVK